MSLPKFVVEILKTKAFTDSDYVKGISSFVMTTFTQMILDQ